MALSLHAHYLASQQCSVTWVPGVSISKRVPCQSRDYLLPISTCKKFTRNLSKWLSKWAIESPNRTSKFDASDINRYLPLGSCHSCRVAGNAAWHAPSHRYLLHPRLKLSRYRAIPGTNNKAVCRPAACTGVYLINTVLYIGRYLNVG